MCARMYDVTFAVSQ